MCNSEFQVSLSLRNSERPDGSRRAEGEGQREEEGRGRGIPECEGISFHSGQKVEGSWELHYCKVL